MWVRLRGVLSRDYHYGDLDSNKRPFLSFGIEQQASIVGDHFRLRHGLQPQDGRGAVSAYEKIIPFLPRRGK